MQRSFMVIHVECRTASQQTIQAAEAKRPVLCPPRLPHAMSTLRSRAGLFIILSLFSVVWKKTNFPNSYTFFSIIVAYETRLTENGLPPERNLRMVN